MQIRTILIVSILTLIVLIGGVYVFNRQQTTNVNPEITTTNPDTLTIGEGGGQSLIEPESCGITAETTAGPYYVSETSEINNGYLNYTNLPGEQIKITGRVYRGEENSTPIPNAKIEIWQADSEGTYHPQSSGYVNQYLPNQIALRGYVLTNQDGYYEFTTIYPGEYTGRTRHIHVKSSASGYQDVITQMILPEKSGDDTSTQEDMIFRSLPVCNLLRFDSSSGTPTANFDFHLLQA